MRSVQLERNGSSRPLTSGGTRVAFEVAAVALTTVRAADLRAEAASMRLRGTRAPGSDVLASGAPARPTSSVGSRSAAATFPAPFLFVGGRRGAPQHAGGSAPRTRPPFRRRSELERCGIDAGSGRLVPHGVGAHCSLPRRRSAFHNGGR